MCSGKLTFMLSRLLPQPATNEYGGPALVRWVFAFVTVVTLARSLVHILAPDGGAQSIATIPLDSFTANGAAATIHLFALWGLSQLLMGLVFVIVLWRYQSLIPLMYLFILLEYSVRLLLTFFKPVETSGTAPGAIGNYILIPLAAVMLWLSLRADPRPDRG